MGVHGGWGECSHQGGRQLCRSWALTHNWRKEFRKCSQLLRHLRASSQAAPRLRHPGMSVPWPGPWGSHQVRRPRHCIQPQLPLWKPGLPHPRSLELTSFRTALLPELPVELPTALGSLAQG